MEAAEVNAVGPADTPAAVSGDVEMKSEISSLTKTSEQSLSRSTHNMAEGNDKGRGGKDESDGSGSDGDGEDEEEEGDGDGDGDEESGDEEAVEEPSLATRRPRRENAGNRMAELLNQSENLLTVAVADGEAKEDNEFYGKLAYGGFHEVDKDEDFTAEKSDEDEEDSDEFDTDEGDEDGEDGQEMGEEEDEERKLRREKRRGIQRAAKQRIIEKNRKWAEARFEKAANAVEENSCDAKTQQQRLREAKKTEALNLASLANFQVELERKKRQSKKAVKPEISGPTTCYIMEPDQSRVLIVPRLVEFPKPEQQKTRACAITGKRAKYVDPLTGLPYADVGAFSVIRRKYQEYVHSLSASENNSGQSTTPTTTDPLFE